MGRAPCCDKANVKKGPWSPDEDAKLKNFINTYGTGGNWITLPTKAGLRRCGKSCRLRWINYLRPDIKHGGFSAEEEQTIVDLHGKVGSRWSLIASKLKGRTDNDIKNYWNTRLKKKLADRGMNSLGLHGYGSSGHHPLSSLGSRPDFRIGPTGLCRDLMRPPFVSYVGSEMDGAGRSARSPFSLLDQQWQQQSQQQPQHRLPVKNELVTENEAVIDQRLHTIQNELLSDILNIGPKEASAATSSTVGSSLTSEVLHQQQSPASSCSAENFYGGQFDESPYCDNVSSMWNGFGDDPSELKVMGFSSGLADMQSSTLRPIDKVMGSLLLQPQRLQVPNVGLMHDDNLLLAAPTTPRRTGSGFLEDVFKRRPADQLPFLPEIQIDRHVVKEEFSSEVSPMSPLSAELLSPGTPSTSGRGSWPRNYSSSNLRCGNGLSPPQQAQLPHYQAPFPESVYRYASKFIST